MTYCILCGKPIRPGEGFRWCRVGVPTSEPPAWTFCARCHAARVSMARWLSNCAITRDERAQLVAFARRRRGFR